MVDGGPLCTYNNHTNQIMKLNALILAFNMYTYAHTKQINRIINACRLHVESPGGINLTASEIKYLRNKIQIYLVSYFP